MDYWKMKEEDRNINLSELVGKTIQVVENENNESILFVCTDLSAYEMYHMQDCCEDVGVYNINGDLQSLVGKTILSITESILGDWPKDVQEPECLESFTWTVFIIETESSTVVIRWLGTSNGYYSESVYLGRTHKPIEINKEYL